MLSKPYYHSQFSGHIGYPETQAVSESDKHMSVMPLPNIFANITLVTHYPSRVSVNRYSTCHVHRLVSRLASRLVIRLDIFQSTHTDTPAVSNDRVSMLNITKVTQDTPQVTPNELRVFPNEFLTEKK